MDGLFHGKPYFLMDDLGVPLFLETPSCVFLIPNKSWLVVSYPKSQEISNGVSWKKVPF